MILILHGRKVLKEALKFLPALNQQHRQFETGLDFLNSSNTQEIDNPKLESSRFQDDLFNQTAGALNFSPDFDKLMYNERLKTRTVQVENCRSKLFGINKDNSTVC